MKEGTYNEDVNDNLNARQRTGTISRKITGIYSLNEKILICQTLQPLRHRERSRILLLCRSWKSNREIADELFLSEGTVRNYISSILDKLSLRDRTQLAVFYLTKVCN